MLPCRVLDLADCRGIGAQSLRKALTASPGLHNLCELRLDGLDELSDQLLSDIALGLPKLQHLSLSRCRAITDAGLRGIAAACPGLKSLCIDDDVRVTDAGLMAVAESCLQIEVCPSLPSMSPLRSTDSSVIVARVPLSQRHEWNSFSCFPKQHVL